MSPYLYEPHARAAYLFRAVGVDSDAATNTNNEARLSDLDMFFRPCLKASLRITHGYPTHGEHSTLVALVHQKLNKSLI